MGTGRGQGTWKLEHGVLKATCLPPWPRAFAPVFPPALSLPERLCGLCPNSSTELLKPRDSLSAKSSTPCTHEILSPCEGEDSRGGPWNASGWDRSPERPSDGRVGTSNPTLRPPGRGGDAEIKTLEQGDWMSFWAGDGVEMGRVLYLGEQGSSSVSFRYLFLSRILYNKLGNLSKSLS